MVNISGNNLEEFAARTFICGEIEKNGATVQGFTLMCDPSVWKVKNTNVFPYVNKYLIHTFRINLNKKHFKMLVVSFENIAKYYNF